MSWSTPVPPRSALLACWTTAWLAAEASLPDLVARVTAYDEGHTVVGLWVDDLELEQALGRLRGDGVTRLRLVLPAPGDPLGLPGPGAFTQAALRAGEGVLALRPDGSGTGLIPTLTSHGSELDGTVTTSTSTDTGTSTLGDNIATFTYASNSSTASAAVTPTTMTFGGSAAQEFTKQ